MLRSRVRRHAGAEGSGVEGEEEEAGSEAAEPGSGAEGSEAFLLPRPLPATRTKN